MDIITKLLSDLPAIHKGETEMPGGYSVNGVSMFTTAQQDKLATGMDACWALGEPVLRYIHENVKENQHTLEIGSGLSTLVFAIKSAYHTSITPSITEITRLQSYALDKGILLDKVCFINEFSERAVPNLLIESKLDFLLIDGKHAFPWPFIDWFYTAVHLKKGGILLVDDTQLITGQLLCDFMKKDPSWEFITILDGKTEIFRKLSEDIRNIAWHMQPFVTDQLAVDRKNKIRSNQSLLSRIKIKLKQVIS